MVLLGRFAIGGAGIVFTEATAAQKAGRITHSQQAEDILVAGQADLIAIGREALVDPMWALHAAQTLGYDPNFGEWPKQSGCWLAVRDKTSEFYAPEI